MHTILATVETYQETETETDGGETDFDGPKTVP
jgi:hypothetical protein